MSESDNTLPQPLEEEKSEDLPEKVRPHAERISSTFNLLLEASASNDNWKKLKASHGVTVFSQDDPDSPIRRAKAQGLMQASLEELLFVLEDDDAYKMVDKYAKCYKLLEALDDNHRVMYSHYKGILTVSDRDFVYLLSKKVYHDGKKLLYCTFSLDEPQVAVPKGVVRACIHYSGWYVEQVDSPSKEDIKASDYPADASGPWLRVTYSAQVDPKGWIPTMVINAMAGALSNLIITIRNNMPKFKRMLEERNAKC